MNNGGEFVGIVVDRFFGEDPRRCSVEDFFGTVKAFLDTYKRACGDIRRNPKKFQQLIYRKLAESYPYDDVAQHRSLRVLVDEGGLHGVD